MLLKFYSSPAKKKKKKKRWYCSWMRNCLEHAFKKTIAVKELEKIFNFPTMKFPPFCHTFGIIMLSLHFDLRTLQLLSRAFHAYLSICTLVQFFWDCFGVCFGSEASFTLNLFFISWTGILSAVRSYSYILK